MNSRPSAAQGDALRTGGTWSSRGILRQNTIDIPIASKKLPVYGHNGPGWPTGPRQKNGSVQRARITCTPLRVIAVQALPLRSAPDLALVVCCQPCGNPIPEIPRCLLREAKPRRLNSEPMNSRSQAPQAHIADEKRQTSHHRGPDRLSSRPTSWLRAHFNVNTYMNGTSMRVYVTISRTREPICYPNLTSCESRLAATEP